MASLTRLVGEILKISGREGLIAFPRIGQGNASALAEMATRDISRSWSEFVVRSNRKSSFKPLRELARNWRSACMYTCTLKHWRHLNRPRRIRRLEQPEGFGPRRAHMIRTALAERLRRPRLRQLRQAQQRPRFPCCLTWTASIGQGQVPGMGVHGTLVQYPPRPRTGLDCRLVSSPEGQCNDRYGNAGPPARTSCRERREAAAASLESQAERGAMGGGCSC